MFTVAALASDESTPREMKVRIFATPDQIPAIADKVLEFYDVTPEYFVAAVGEAGYDEMLRKGLQVEILVPDVRARALELAAFFHTYEQIRDTWTIIAQNHPDICVLDTLGLSADDHLLLAMKVSDNPGVMEQEPRICFDFTIHGNENNATEIAHYALLDLVQKYGTDPEITSWVNSREIWLLPIVNPDGLISRQRYNGNGVDCNRNYGYSWDGGGPGVFSEPETRALYFLGRDNPMASWTQYHSGTKRAMWCWGYTTKAPMDSTSCAYEMQRYEQLTGLPAGQISRILYPVHGGSTDWYYGATGALGFGIEVCGGQPSPPSEIDTINHANWTAMKEMIRRVVRGVSGRVIDSVSGKPVEARVELDGPDWFTFSDTMGYFHKYVGEGTYSVRAVANGYAPETITGVVVPPDTSVNVVFRLVPDTVSPVCPLRVITNKIRESPDNSNPTNAWWALGGRDDRRFSLGRGGWASFDMGRSSPILNGPGDDFCVVEDDGDPEACTVYVSNDWNGPWHYVGFGTGTQSHDLTAAGVSSARYIRIADDNIGGSGAYAGFDLDAIEGTAVIAPTVVYESDAVIDSPPGGNADGKLDASESADLVVTVRNVGRIAAQSLAGVLRTDDPFVSIVDSLADYGNLSPESVRSNTHDRFRVAAAWNTPRGHRCGLKMYMSSIGYVDSIEFEMVVGTLRNSDPIPDGPRQPALYWAYDDKDTLHQQRPVYSWVEINSLGTKLNYSNNDAVIVVNLPSDFGPFKYYGQRYTQLSVSADGWIAPGNYTTQNYTNTCLPSMDAPPGAICVNWDDLYVGHAGIGYAYYYHDAANHRFIIQFDSIAYYDPRTVRDKFEVLFYDTTLAAPSGDNEFVFQYKTANGYTDNTVGIQDPGKAIGIQCLCENSYDNGCWPLEPGRAVKYTTDIPVGVAERSEEVPPGVPVLNAGANPFVNMTTLTYYLMKPGLVDLSVYDGTGRKVRTLVSGVSEAGRYHAAWSGMGAGHRQLAAGVYWFRLEVDGSSTVVKAVKVR